MAAGLQLPEYGKKMLISGYVKSPASGPGVGQEGCQGCRLKLISCHWPEPAVQVLPEK